MDDSGDSKQATLYRMATERRLCPYGLQARHLLRREGYAVDDRLLRSRAEIDRFKREHGVASTPQVFIDSRRIGGYDDLQRHFGRPPPDPNAPSTVPVAAVFGMAAAMAVAASVAGYGAPLALRALQLFGGFAMCLLAMLKLQDLRRFATMFLTYDLLAQRFVPYARIYPFAEAGAGILMVSGRLAAVSAPVALFIGAVGAWSVVKAVFVDGRELKCACVGGSGNVPLGALSLAENLMMVGMGLWMAHGLWR